MGAKSSASSVHPTDLQDEDIVLASPTDQHSVEWLLHNLAKTEANNKKAAKSKTSKRRRKLSISSISQKSSRKVKKEYSIKAAWSAEQEVPKAGAATLDALPKALSTQEPQSSTVTHSSHAAGGRVTIKGLESSTQFNGQSGVVVGPKSNGRIKVQLDTREQIALKQENLDTDVDTFQTSAPYRRSRRPSQSEANPSLQQGQDIADTKETSSVLAATVSAVSSLQSESMLNTKVKDRHQSQSNPLCIVQAKSNDIQGTGSSSVATPVAIVEAG